MSLREHAFKAALDKRGAELRELLAAAGGSVERALLLWRRRRGAGGATWAWLCSGWCVDAPDGSTVSAQRADLSGIAVWPAGVSRQEIGLGARPAVVVPWAEVLGYVAGQWQPELPGFTL